MIKYIKILFPRSILWLFSKPNVELTVPVTFVIFRRRGARANHNRWKKDVYREKTCWHCPFEDLPLKIAILWNVLDIYWWDVSIMKILLTLPKSVDILLHLDHARRINWQMLCQSGICWPPIGTYNFLWYN